MSIFQAFAAGFNLFFSLWPLVLLGPLGQRKNPLPLMKQAWGFMAFVWLLARLASLPLSSFLIPEPLNTFLFFATGMALFLYSNREQIQLRDYLRGRGDSATSPKDLLDLSHNDFENMVVELFTASGHKAKRTGAIGDHGVDVVVQAKNSEKWVVQCKRWSGNVGEPVIRDFYGVMHHEKADKGMIITTGTFTPQAREWAKGKPLELLEGREFLARWKKARSLAAKK